MRNFNRPHNRTETRQLILESIQGCYEAIYRGEGDDHIKGLTIGLQTALTYMYGHKKASKMRDKVQAEAEKAVRRQKKIA